MGLLFKAPTKRSTKAALGGKNLWQPEEDDELSSLYDQHRLEPDCLERIVREFEERRNKQQIIKRMLQLHLIADKSEILPAKASKGKRKPNKQKQQQHEDEEDGDYMEEPTFGEPLPRRKASKPNKAKAKPKQRVRTPLDLGTVRALIAQVDAEVYREALDWLKESLLDASEDTDEAGDEDEDGVPLLPLLDSQKDAMELGDFQKVLVALGIQPPIVGMESYWRIPSYLNAADLKLRAKIVAGEQVDDEEEEEEEEEDNESDEAAEEDSDGEEEDYLDKRSRQRLEAAAVNITIQQQQKLDSLMYSKSDEEAEQRTAPKAKTKAKRKTKRKISSEDEEEVNEIARKLERKKRQPDVSSEEEEEKEQHSKLNTDDLFEQLKAKRATKIKMKDMTLSDSGKAAAAAAEKGEQDDDDDDALNFNTEDYRARLLELEDEQDEAEEPEHDKENATLQANNTIKAPAAAASSTTRSLQRTRRANVIDSDSDNDADADGVATASKTNKRPRSSSSDNEQDEPKTKTNGNDDDDDEDEDINFLARKKPAKANEMTSKRRRLAVIDDDDDDDDDF